MPAIALVGAAVEMMERTQATMRIEELTRRIGLSQSALERRFRRLVGASPRRFASLVRLQHVVRLREARQVPGLAACLANLRRPGLCEKQSECSSS